MKRSLATLMMAGALAAAGSSVRAQYSAGGGQGTHPKAAGAAVDGKSGAAAIAKPKHPKRPRRGWRRAAAARARRLARNGTPAQKAWAQSLVAERQQLKSQVKAGTLTKKSAGQQLRAWLDAHRPPRKA